MTYTELIAYIDQNIITNGNQQITAAVLNPVLDAIVEYIESTNGDIDSLETQAQTLVGAINELQGLIGNQVVILSGEQNPNIAPPINFELANFYNQIDQQGQTIAFYIYNGIEWVLLTNNGGTTPTTSGLLFTQSFPDAVTVTGTTRATLLNISSGSLQLTPEMMAENSVIEGLFLVNTLVSTDGDRNIYLSIGLTDLLIERYLSVDDKIPYNLTINFHGNNSSQRGLTITISSGLYNYFLETTIDASVNQNFNLEFQGIDAGDQAKIIQAYAKKV